MASSPVWGLSVVRDGFHRRLLRNTACLLLNDVCYVFSFLCPPIIGPYYHGNQGVASTITPFWVVPPPEVTVLKHLLIFFCC